jgi:hypothetical protein
MAFDVFNIGNKTKTAGIMLIGRVIKALTRGQARAVMLIFCRCRLLAHAAFLFIPFSAHRPCRIFIRLNLHPICLNHPERGIFGGDLRVSEPAHQCSHNIGASGTRFQVNWSMLLT